VVRAVWKLLTTVSSAEPSAGGFTGRISEEASESELEVWVNVMGYCGRLNTMKHVVGKRRLCTSKLAAACLSSSRTLHIHAIASSRYYRLQGMDVKVKVNFAL
jgi:hypothetical protein